MERDLIPSDQKPIQQDEQRIEVRPIVVERKGHLSKRSLEVKARLERLRKNRIHDQETLNLQFTF